MTTMNLQSGIITEIADDLAQILQEHLDWEIMMDMIKSAGYTHITMPWPNRIDEIQANEIKKWCQDNLNEHYKGRGPDWLFKSKKDATLFALRWM